MAGQGSEPSGEAPQACVCPPPSGQSGLGTEKLLLTSGSRGLRRMFTHSTVHVIRAGAELHPL